LKHSTQLTEDIIDRTVTFDFVFFLFNQLCPRYYTPKGSKGEPLKIGECRRTLGKYLARTTERQNT